MDMKSLRIRSYKRFRHELLAALPYPLLSV